MAGSARCVAAVVGFLAISLGTACLPGPAAAQAGPYGFDGFGYGGPMMGPYGDGFGPGWRSNWRGDPYAGRQDRLAGHVTSATFAAKGAAAKLGHGPIDLVDLPESTPDKRVRLEYEAAVLDRLGAAGYNIDTNGKDAPQVARISIIRNVVEPAQPKRNPVSGEAAVSVSNYGTAYGLALSVDATKPLKALISTRMRLRIVDRATGKVLWEGRARIMTRDQDPHWTQDRIARRLAAALVKGFPVGDPN